MNDNVVNFNKVRKSKARHQKVLRAAGNRAKFGMNKSEKEKAAALTKKLQGHLDGHKLDVDKTDDAESVEPKTGKPQTDKLESDD